MTATPLMLLENSAQAADIKGKHCGDRSPN